MNTNKRIYFSEDIFKDYTKKPRRLIKDLSEQSSLETNLKPSACKHITTNLFRASAKEKLELNISETKELILEICYNCDSVRSITIRA